MSCGPRFRLVLPAANHAEERVDVWLPREFAPGLLYRGLTLFGRVAPGATVGQAQAELNALAASFAASHPSAYPERAAPHRPAARRGRDARREAGADGARRGGRVRAPHRLRQRRQPAPGARQDTRARACGPARARRHAAPSDAAAPCREPGRRHPRRRLRPAAGAAGRRACWTGFGRCTSRVNPRSPSTGP